MLLERHVVWYLPVESLGSRDVVKYLLKYRLVDVFVTTAGGVEEDLIKHFGEYRKTEFQNEDCEGFEKQGNILVPKEAQQRFKEWFLQVIRELHAKQDVKQGVVWTPNSIIYEMGKRINDPNTCLHWCAANQIPVYSPAFTDGFMGECLYEYNSQHPGFIIDIAKDIFLLNKTPHYAKCTGALIFGAGFIKHHILNANLMRNGLDFAVLRG